MDLQAAIDAIVANVFAHTPEETPFGVTVTLSSGECTICVEDRGPGINTHLLARGHSGGESTGLGLDIAGRTVEQAHGRLSIAERPGGGSIVTMTFPIEAGAFSPADPLGISVQNS
jgi:signal transduction histidine kinase